MLKDVRNIHPLLLTALVVDLLTPLLIWKGFVPGSVRWLSQAAIVMMGVIVLLRMLRFGRIPVAALALACLAGATATIATLNDQRVMATAWGGWVMFQFPLVAVFAYLQPKWPKDFAPLLTNFCVAALGLQVLVQLAQYAAGQRPGDDLAGTFGQHGTGILFLFNALAVCFCLGRYMNVGKWRLAGASLALAAVSSTLGEMKMFVVAAALLGVLSVVVVGIRDRRLGKVMVQGAAFAASVGAFFLLYNAVIIAASETGRPNEGLESYLNQARASQYLGGIRKERTHEGLPVYNMGRNYAVAYGWNSIKRDSVTALCGFGLGARSDSESLGIKGVGLLHGGRGMAVGTGLTVLLQEMGLLGIAALVVIVGSIMAMLAVQIRKYPGSNVNELRYGLLLFSAMWPAWLWYNLALTMRAPMLVYFLALGYALSAPEDRGQTEDESLLEAA